MQDFLSPLRLAVMESRFQKMKKESIIRDLRRKGKTKPSQSRPLQSASAKSQSLVREIKALESAASHARQKALDAFTNPVEPFAESGAQAKRHVVVRSPFESSSDIPFKYMSIVFEIGDVIGNKVALDNRSETLAGENIPSLMLSISKLGTDDYKVYPSFEAAKAAADNDNAAINAYMQTLAKAHAK
ncbi:hypothetical protein DSM25558_4678 [Agrobacterium sp. DSM 25558]|uniref:hypothetical protein n=1 Tax=Agrobacterium sp. DSM 25558 TaxID=1907665 RepID=UPI0009724264|nr:hypothetical protein [Agrobacterium sp. DSM 25558]SCX29400.1 hypothetical protein DSM25558_4678 [Agrobacterium sp. DSM 25558]